MAQQLHYNMKNILFLTVLILTGCSFNFSSDFSLNGNWLNEDEDTWGGFKFLDNNQCGFSGGSKSVEDGIGFPCTYIIKGKIVEITFSDPNNSEKENVVSLEYNVQKDSLIFNHPETGRKPEEFFRE